MVQVTFLPGHTKVEVSKGSTIMQAAIAAGVPLESACGGRGTCGKCKVQIDPEKVDPTQDVGKKFLSDAEREVGWVLACRVAVDKDLTVKLSEYKDAHQRKTQLNQLTDVELAPGIQKHFLQLTRPTVEDQTPDWDRLVAALPSQKISFNRSIAAQLPQVLHQANFQVTAVLDGDKILSVEPGDTTLRNYGLAIDIGTTTTVVYLMDLLQGKVLASGAVTNPQRAYGADVISRITHAAQGPEQLQELQELVIGGLNEIIVELCAKSDVSKEEIYQAVVVGNTTMSHLFLGIDPTYLAPAPFIPVFRQEIEVEARELGLGILRTGHVVLLPNVAGYVGADTVGVMVAVKVDQLPGYTLAIDIGTNGEIILAGEKRILTCSTAAGPAFEGAEIKYGMRAADGAIERVTIQDDVECVAIGGTKPIGICGSGLIDAIAQMAESGVIYASGRIVNSQVDLDKLPPSLQQRIRRTTEGSEFVLVWAKETEIGEDIVLTQKDIREMQLAKGAIRAGVSILMKEMGIGLEQLDRVLLAGAFGNYISKDSALGIGLLPDLPLEKITAIGNAAGDGAKMVLLSQVERIKATEFANLAEHLELSTRMDFQEEFIDALSFEHQ
ncbi:putative metal-binding protein [Desulfitobacterium dichloroeliminans LMG P-21439]|uniref:Putative metal-binding protein n=1 Tax=Desulfitobacterium dichloroeliminans (strain LMG P-21439 / DCA1) TaxID=871963 RepID=L0F9V0_DESDL|nr:ASKHA domain-containing protein [Desulfitobacterium dichloroeliminans]AGA69723.1 putative metal-binding protein [Desulfitobacterium dichloroeliminans LMG P-21439]